MFSKYYQSELTYLREVGKQFGEANPTIGGLLTERGTDPDVERLLEGFAFLSAQTRARVDDCVPEIAHALAELLLPHFLRSIPATSIIQFTPQPGALRERHRIERGTPLGATAIDGTSCTFRTTADIDLLPLTIKEVVLDESVASTPVLRLRFICTEKALPSVFDRRGFRLHLAGDYPAASTLSLWFSRYCKEIMVTGFGQSPGDTVTLPSNIIKTQGWEPSEAMLPWPRFSPNGYRLLQEYFAMPSKFLFVDITGLDAALPIAQEEFEIAFAFDRPPQLDSQMNAEAIRLHCAPVINLFSVSANPFKGSEIGHNHLLTGADIHPRHMDVYSVDAVKGILQGVAEGNDYHPFLSFSHARPNNNDGGAYYNLTRRLSPIDGGIDTYFSVRTPRDTQPQTKKVTFSIDLTCTNRALPTKLGAGKICESIMGSPTVARFKNISKVTRPVAMPLGSELYWRLIAHLGLNRTTLSRTKPLRSLLELYNFNEASDQAQGRANRLRAESLGDVTFGAVNRVFGGVAIRGSQTRVDVQQSGFASEGDAFLFGNVLDRIFADQTSINSFHELVLTLQPTLQEYRWAPRSSEKSLL